MRSCRVAIRLDASIEIGLGHLMRCLTLGELLKSKGAEVVFICRLLEGGLHHLIEGRGFELHLLGRASTTLENTSPELCQHNDAALAIPLLEAFQPDWLIIDHYALGEDWEAAVRPYSRKLMVIDDLANRKHYCDLLLDQTFGRQKREYADLVSGDCQILPGSRYALLRPGFKVWRPYSLARRVRPQLKNILVTMGGVDRDNYSEKVLDVLEKCPLPEIESIIVVLGGKAPFLDTVKARASTSNLPVEIRVDVADMAELMARSDLAIGAAGTTTWERCALGLPCIQLAVADNQNQIMAGLAEVHAILQHDLGNPDSLATYLADNRDMLAKISLVSSSITDGGGADRVVEIILGSGVFEVREVVMEPVKSQHQDYLYQLQTMEGVRRFFRNPALPRLEEHGLWFQKMMASTEVVLFVLTEGSENVGMLRLDEISHDTVEVSIIIDPSHSGKGIGSRSIGAIISMLPGRRILGVVHRENTASRRLFEKQGFEQAGKQDEFLNYYRLT